MAQRHIGLSLSEAEAHFLRSFLDLNAAAFDDDAKAFAENHPEFKPDRFLAKVKRTAER